MRKNFIGIVLIVLVAFSASYFVAKQNSNGEQPSQTTATSGSSGITLDLSGQQLTTLPESLLGRADIKVLNLSNNQLTSLPPGIATLTNIEVLNVENNRLTSLPPEISQLKKLRQIYANNNRMTSLPAELSTMAWLQLLDISGNNIPASNISDIKAKLANTQVKP